MILLVFWWHLNSCYWCFFVFWCPTWATTFDFILVLYWHLNYWSWCSFWFYGGIVTNFSIHFSLLVMQLLILVFNVRLDLLVVLKVQHSHWWLVKVKSNPCKIISHYCNNKFSLQYAHIHNFYPNSKHIIL